MESADRTWTCGQIGRRARCAAAALAVVLPCAASMGQLAVVDGPVQDASTGHWYVLIAQGSWDQANSTAAFMGGYLAEINDLNENRFVNDNLLTANLTMTRRGWIGLTDRAIEGDFEWSNGDPFDDFFDPADWAMGEPSDNPGHGYTAGSLPGEDYVEMIGSLDDTNDFRGEWNDATNLGNPGNGAVVRYGIVEFDQIVGACTLPDTSCSPMTESDCTAAGGTYMGDFSQCPGPLPDGACCLLDGTCVMTNADGCTSMSNIGAGITAIFNDNGSTCGSVVCEQISPANDSCADAIDVGLLPASVFGTTVAASPDGASGCDDVTDTSGGVWYTVVGTGDTITASTCEDNGGLADYDTKISVFCASCGTLDHVCVTANDDDCSTTFANSTVSWCSAVGTTYYVLVHGYGAGMGTFTLSVTDDGIACSGAVDCNAPMGACCIFDGTCVDATEDGCISQGGTWEGAGTTCGTTDCPNLLPTNDECVDAEQISGTGLFPFDNNYASTSAEQGAGCTTVNSDLWYCWTSPGTGQATVTTVGGTSLDTVLTVYDGCTCPPSTLLGCNDDDVSVQSTVVFPAVAGNSYMIQLGSWSTVDQGNGTFQVTLDTPGACCLNDGSCTMLSEGDCFAARGTFHGIGTTCGDVQCPDLYALDTPIALNYNWNGIVHAPTEQNDPDNLDGFRSIADRALLFANSTPPNFGTNSSMAYSFVDTPYTLDMIYLGNRNLTNAGCNCPFDTVVDGDDIGVQPNWLATVAITSNTTTVSPGVTLDDESQVGVIYHYTNGGGSFDVTLGFSDATSVTYTVNAGDWFADFDPTPAAPGLGVAVQALIAGPLSNGDGFPGAEGHDAGGASNPLNIVEAVATRDSLLSDMGFNISGKTLTSIMFSGRSNNNGAAGIFAASVRTSGAAACPCELDGDDAQVNVFDLLAYLSLWFPQNGMSGMGLSADFNNSGNVDVFDLLDFLSCWFPASAGNPCP